MACKRVTRTINDATAPASRSLLAVNVVAEQLRFGMEGLAGGSGTLGTSLMRLGPLGLAAAAALGAFGLAVAGGIREIKEAEQAVNQLNAALKATDSASGVTTGQILELGEAVEKNTLFKKEEVLKAASALNRSGCIRSIAQEIAAAWFLLRRGRLLLALPCLCGSVSSLCSSSLTYYLT